MNNLFLKGIMELHVAENYFHPLDVREQHVRFIQFLLKDIIQD